MSHAHAAYVAIIGGGPSGLMAAEALALAGVPVTVFEAKPSLGRKFLRAGIGGLNLTHGEDYAVFCSRFGDRLPWLQSMLDRYSPSDVRRWAQSLGVETFEGSSGRVFPVDMKAAPLLRAWVQRLRSLGVRFRLRHQWLGWDADGALRLSSPAGEQVIKPLATVLALGGGSWPQLGSDAAWVPWLQARGVEVATIKSANCGFDVDWTPYLRTRFAGAQIKAVALSFTDAQGHTETRRGEFVITDYGVEGSLIYAFSKSLRDAIDVDGQAVFLLDLLPGHTAERVLAELSHPRGARSMSSHLQSRLGITGIKSALLHEVLDKDVFLNPAQLALAIKALPITLVAARPPTEAISTAGGVCFEAVDERLMLKAIPGVFVAGEMLDWEAPTGGYLLTACLAQGLWAGESVKDWLRLCTGSH